MNRRNYQAELDEIIKTAENDGRCPSLLLHACCAPCSSYVMKYLSEYFKITILYYNPNIYPEEEYKKRVAEIKRLINEMPVNNPVELIEGRYEPSEFFEAVKGLEKEPEGGNRCRICYEMRLREAAEYALSGGYDYFATTLSISPLKKSDILNEIGEKIAMKYGICHLPSDFKKKDGYKQSVELSKEYNLYRQNFCGCIFSKRKVE